MLHIISPHIDDAFLSIGGIICCLREKSVQITIDNIFTISNWVNSAACDVSKFENNTELVTSQRKSEEALLGNKLSYNYSFFSFEDSSVRPPCTIDDQHKLAIRIEKKLLNILRKEDIVFSPLGIYHMDHILVSKIGLSLLTKGYNIIFYEDMPYAALANFSYEEHYRCVVERNLSPYCIEIDIEKKLSHLKCYKTQVCDSWLKDIKNYSYSLKENKFFERFWQSTERGKNPFRDIMRS